jgi:hypothetical protein
MCRLGDRSRQPLRAGEVPAGATWDDGKVDPVAPGDRVRDLIDGSVAADDHEERRAAVDRLRRELGQMPRPLREERVALEAGRRRLVRELRPVLPRRLVVRGGVDEEDDRVSQR